MADDCAAPQVCIQVNSQEELEDYLRSYLPYAYRDQTWVWIVYKVTPNSVLLYYYLTPIVQYFVSPENPPALEDGDALSCRLITSKWAKDYKDFPTEGNFLHRVRQYVEVQGKNI